MPAGETADQLPQRGALGPRVGVSEAARARRDQPRRAASLPGKSGRRRSRAPRCKAADRPRSVTLSTMKPMNPQTLVQGRLSPRRLLASWIDAGDAVLVDVREPTIEHAEERIDGRRAAAAGTTSFDRRVALAVSGTGSRGWCSTVEPARGRLDAAERFRRDGRARRFISPAGIEGWKAARRQSDRAST